MMELKRIEVKNAVEAADVDGEQLSDGEGREG